MYVPFHLKKSIVIDHITLRARTWDSKYLRGVWVKRTLLKFREPWDNSNQSHAVLRATSFTESSTVSKHYIPSRNTWCKSSREYWGKIVISQFRELCDGSDILHWYWGKFYIGQVLLVCITFYSRKRCMLKILKNRGYWGYLEIFQFSRPCGELNELHSILRKFLHIYELNNYFVLHFSRE